MVIKEGLSTITKKNNCKSYKTLTKKENYLSLERSGVGTCTLPLLFRTRNYLMSAIFEWIPDESICNKLKTKAYCRHITMLSLKTWELPVRLSVVH